MAVRKFVKHAAPYTSQTFNDTNARLSGVNGVLSGGAVTTSGSVVTIQPIVFIQMGGIVDIDTPLSATLPGSLQAPYFVAVSVSSMVENLGEVITPTFVKRPEDITPNTVLIAEWDGQEWRQLPELSLGSILASNQATLEYLGVVGVTEGFDITTSGSTFVVAAGAAVAKDGTLVSKQYPATIPMAVSAVGSLNRVDELVLRKPTDSPARAATIQLLTGMSYDPSGVITTTTPFTLGAGVSQASAPKILVNPSGTGTYYIFRDGAALKFAASTTTAITSATSPVTLAASGVSDFSALFNADGSIDVVYVKSGTSLAYQRVDTSGATIYAENIIIAGSAALATPKIVSIASGAGYFLHIVLTEYISGSEADIGYIRLSASNTVETSYQTFVNLGDILANPSIDKDDDDSLLYLVFESSTTNRMYLRTYDASTVTASSPPAMLGASLELQNNTYDISNSALLSPTGATQAVVKRTANKDLFVFWRHFKGSGNYGVAIYNAKDPVGLGYKAYVQDYVSPAENISEFDIRIDSTGSAHLILNNGAKVAYAKVLLETLALQNTTKTLSTIATATDVSIRITPDGRLVHGYAESTTKEAHVLTSTGAMSGSLRDVYTLSSDLLLGAYRNADSVLSVQGTFLEENSTVRRLYEYNNIFAATGSVTWGVTSNTLVINASIAMHLFNRAATYTILADNPTGVIVPLNSVCYVQLPDTDVSATLPLIIKSMGTGILDRHNRNSIPIFWNIGGTLYTKFAPFQITSGSTVVVGSQITDNLIAWLGSGGVNPDPTDHGYSSTNNILQTDSILSAIGKLDAASFAISSNEIAGIQTIGSGVKFVSVVFGTPRAAATYRVSATMENLIDTDPMTMPVIITAKATTGFTASWNVALDTANYSLDWIIRDT